MSDLRLADLLVGLSGVTDLGMGQPPGAAARACLLSTSLARAAGLAESDVQDVFYTSMLQHIGCTAYSHESSAYYPDEQSIKQVSAETNFDDMKEIFLSYLPSVTRKAPSGARLKTFRSALLRGNSITEGYTRSNCEVGSNMARRLGLSPNVQRGLLHIFEWWNGRGRPRHLKGEEISLATRVAHVGGYGALFARLGGPEAAVGAIRERSGGYLDPALAEEFCRNAGRLLGELASADVFVALGDVEPQKHLTVSDARLDDVLRAFGDVVDLKAPCFHGHGFGVAELGGAAAAVLSLPERDAVAVRRAGFVHDLGRAAVANGIWERPGPLRTDEWSQVRLHPYHSEQILERSEPIAHLAPLAAAHHERLDGSGYYRRSTAAVLPMAARVLAAASAFQAMIQPRPHRPALTRERAAAELRTAAAVGVLDHEAVEAVLQVAGQEPARVRRAWPAGLTDRQVEVLRLVTEGLSNRAVAARLHVSTRTAEHHVQDVYAKIGVSSRAAAALFAMEHHLLQPKDW